MVSDIPFYSEQEMLFDLRIQKMDIQRCYPHSKTVANEKCLITRIWIKDDIYLNDYEAIIFYEPNAYPLAYFQRPVIKPSAAIHMFSGGNLCLFDPAHLGYRHRFSIAREIIPLVVKWIHYYEIWIENGNHWIGPETPHGSRPDIQNDLRYFRT